MILVRALPVVALLLLVACGGGGTPPQPDPSIYVNGLSGNDANPGTAQAPVATISRALAIVGQGGTIAVAPYVYATSSGESFPLIVPEQVRLVGDKANYGAGAALFPTLIMGGGSYEPDIPMLSAAVVLRAGARLEGFGVSNPLPPGGGGGNAGVVIYGDDAFVGSCTVEDCNDGILLTWDKDTGLYPQGCAIVGNIIRDNETGIRCAFSNGPMRVASNWLHRNFYGVEVSNAGPDLGGGSAGSAGLNTFACNQKHLLVLGDSSNTPYTLHAAGNSWDELPLVIVNTPVAPGHVVVGTGAAVDLAFATGGAACP